jgi:uncharacterized damage-inducible protein DinB
LPTGKFDSVFVLQPSGRFNFRVTTHFMHKHFYNICTELNRQRADLLDHVREITSEHYGLSPSPGKWSIGQILTHLVTSEKLSLGYMKKKALGIDQLKNSGVKEAIRLRLLIISQRLPFRYNAPQVVVENTPEAWPLDELIHQWDKVRADLAEFLEGIKEENIYKVIYKHPVGGRMDVHQAMTFFREHINHHKPQIDRLLKLKQ